MQKRQKLCKTFENYYEIRGFSKKKITKNRSKLAQKRVFLARLLQNVVGFVVVAPQAQENFANKGYKCRQRAMQNGGRLAGGEGGGSSALLTKAQTKSLRFPQF